MKRVPLILLIVFLAVNTQAAPVEVVFYPDNARITEVAKVPIKIEGSLKKAVITIPGMADPETFTAVVTAGGGVVEDQKWTQTTRQDEEKIKELKKKIEEQREVRFRIQSRIKALDTEIQFWQQQTKTKMKTLGDINSLAATVGRNVNRLAKERLGLDPELEKVDKIIARLQEELSAAAGRKETAWEITLLLSGVSGAEATFRYTYFLRECGWTPLYRLEAQPLKKNIVFSWEAEIWQSSGKDWNNTTVRLANLQPVGGLDPQDIPPWVIKPRPVLAYPQVERSLKARMMERDDRETMSAVEVQEVALPVLRQSGAYSSWDLGRRSLPAGTRNRVKVLQEHWPAEFTYLARPSRSDAVFVRGVVKFPEPREIPQGVATFLLDGGIVGKRSFRVSSGEETIHFGVDPLVRVKEVLLSKQAGERSFFKDSAVHHWRWRLELENIRPYTVRVRLESPLPQIRDEKIRATVKNDPEAVEKTQDMQIWLLDVPSAGKMQITSSVSIEAPKDMPLDLGWR